MIGWLARQVAPVDLDLLELALGGIKAVGPPAYAQRLPLRLQRDLAFIGGASAGGDQLVTGNALFGAGRGGKAQVQVTLARSEFAQGAHGDGVDG